MKYIKLFEQFVNTAVQESTEVFDIIKDLDKVKNDLIKKVDILIAKKKKLYSNVDIESPMSTDEKKLDKDISDIFSEIQQLILQKRKIKNESVSITERIKASEAYYTMEAVQTVIDDKRDLAFISTMDNPIYRPNNIDELAAMQHGLDNGLTAIEVKGKPDGRAWVLYKKNKKAAQKLADYAENKGGYLSDSTPEEAKYVGDLLGYDKADIQAFIKRVYKK